MKSQLRKHIKYTWRVKFRQFVQQARLGHLGNSVFIDKRVEFMRFPKNISVKSNAVVKEGARICSCNEDAIISIGKNTTIGYHTFIFASAGIDIGDDCLIAPFVYIVDSDHNISRTHLINQQGNISEKIIIENDVWIGTGAKILKGVTIRKGAIIAAGSLVNKDIEEYAIYGGIPAVKISERK